MKLLGPRHGELEEMCQDQWWSEEGAAQDSDVRWLKQQVPRGLAGLNWEGGIPSLESDLCGGARNKGHLSVDIPSPLQLVSRSLDVFPAATVPPSSSVR